MTKFIEENGVKYEADENGAAIVDTKGEKKVFVEAKADEKKEEIDLAKLTTEELAKVNPEVAKILSDANEAKEKLEKLNKAEEERLAEEKKSGGKFQELYETEEKKRKDVETELAKAMDTIKKYKDTTNNVLTDVLKTIPKENQALIPSDYSERQKLEYIASNQKMLGGSFATSKGSAVEANQDEPDASSDEAKLVKEIDALLTKGKEGGRTTTEDTLLWEKSKLLKEMWKGKK